VFFFFFEKVVFFSSQALRNRQNIWITQVSFQFKQKIIQSRRDGDEEACSRLGA